MAKTINTILVDDEAGCIANLQHYLHKYCPEIQVIGTAADVTGAAELLNTLPVHLAFLDVHLFDQNIFDVLPDIIREDLSIVFVTAYEQYALSAFRVSALDYILKPLESAEIISCYRKIIRHYNTSAREPAVTVSKSRKIILRQGDHVYLVSVENIIFLKAHGFYTKVCFEYDNILREIMICKPINVVHQEWETPLLMRVHRSYVINLKRVSSIKKKGPNLSIEIGNAVVPVAKRRVADFLVQYDA